LRRVGIAGIATILLVVAAVAYLQSADGFARVVRPLAASFLDGELSVVHGRLGLTGTLELEGLHYRGADGDVALGVDRLRLEFEPGTLVFEGHLAGRSLDAEGLELSFGAAADPQREAGEPTPVKKELEPWLAWATRLPLSFARARVQTRLIAVRSDRRRLLLGPGVLEAEGLGVGETIGLKAESDFQIGDRGDPDDYVGNARLEIDAELSEDGRSLHWDGSLISEIRDLAGSDAGGTAVRLEVLSRGDLTEGAASPIELTLRVFDDERSFGRMAAQLSLGRGWRGSTSLAGLPANFTASVELEALTAEALNPMLAPQSSARFERALLEGEVEISGRGGVVDFEVDVRGSDCSLRPEPGARPNPPVSFGASQRGSWNREGDQLALDRLELQIDSGGAQVLQLSLGSRMVLDLDPADQTHAWLGTGADLRARVSDLDLQNLGTWLAIARGADNFPVQEGRASGELAFRSDDAGGYIALEGELEIEGLSWRAGEPRRGVEPVDFATGFHGRLYGVHRVEIESLGLEFEEGGESIASGSAVGAVNLGPGSWKLELSVQVANPMHAVARLQLADIPDGLRLETGASRAKWTLERAGADAPLQIAGDAELDGVAWNHLGGLRRIGPLDLVAAFETRVVDGGAVIERGRVEFFDGGASVAVAGLRGHVDPADSRSKLDMTVTATDLTELIGRLELFEESVEEAIRSGPVEARWSWEQSGTPGVWEVAMSLDAEGVVLAPRSAGWSLGPTELALRVDAHLLDGHVLEIGESRLDLLSQKGRAVHTTATGRFDLAKGEILVEIAGETADLVTTFERLELVELASRIGLQGGEGRAHWKLQRAQSEGALEIAGEIELRELRLAEGGTAGVSRDLEAALQLVLSPEAQAVEISGLAIELTEGADTRAKLVASGSVPLAAEADVDGARPPSSDAGLEVSASFAHLRLDPYLDPWLDGESSEPEEAPPEIPSAEPVDTAAVSKGFPMNVELTLEDVDWRAMHVDSARLLVIQDGQQRHIELPDARGLGGELNAEYTYAIVAGRQSVSWRLQAKELKVGDIARSLEPDEPRRVSGLLALETSGAGEAGPGVPLLPQVGGALELSVRNGRLQRSGLLSQMSRTLSIGDLQQLAFDTILGQFSIVRGVAQIDEGEVSGVGIRLDVDGAIGLDGTLDLRVSPRFSSSLIDRTRIPLVGQSFRVAGDLFALPVDFTASGPISRPVYGVVPRFVDGRELEGTVRDSIGLGRKAIDSITAGVGGGARSAGGILRRTLPEGSGSAEPVPDTSEQDETGASD